jgi:hypothetical protein
MAARNYPVSSGTSKMTHFTLLILPMETFLHRKFFAGLLDSLLPALTATPPTSLLGKRRGAARGSDTVELEATNPV